MPPQGLLLMAALLPKSWEVRFVDENIRPVTGEEFRWCDAVFLSGMHIQRPHIDDLNQRAHAHDKLTVLGGPSVSSAPEYYPDIDLIHCGEAGDGTIRLFRRLDAGVSRPESQEVYQTVHKLAMAEMPSPAYHLANLPQYLLGSVQFSSGCPFTCEFCDIPALYGRNPRLKRPEQIIAELDQLADGGVVSVYFVDDNFIGNPKATEELMPHLVAWQKRRRYQVRLSCEATLNMSRYPDILSQMREAFFTNVFFGIETPDPAALKAMKKAQNLRSPIDETVETFNRYGIEVASGIIMGLDTDTDETAQAIIDFVSRTGIPILTVNILYALPKTALHARLARAGRLVSDEGRDSNIAFLRPYERVVEDWRRVIRHIYEPGELYRRYEAQAEITYRNRYVPPVADQLTWANLKRFIGVSWRMLWIVGGSDYREHFWAMFWRQLRLGNIETIIQVGMVAHHLILYARDCTRDRMQASNYSARNVAAVGDVAKV
ncbi:MAG: B12-binding domain-containing radical SAM protein [Candidatus Methylacidiphilales bacterium]|nr:B12-binding domain-containing radical SAM protein [Candidatus Methylacidiphilales bacterium]